MRPAVPERHAIQDGSIRPDRSERIEQRFQYRAGRQRSLRGAARKDIIEAARARRIAERKQIRPALQGRAETIQQRRSPGRA